MRARGWARDLLGHAVGRWGVALLLHHWAGADGPRGLQWGPGLWAGVGSAGRWAGMGSDGGALGALRIAEAHKYVAESGHKQEHVD